MADEMNGQDAGNGARSKPLNKEPMVERHVGTIAVYLLLLTVLTGYTFYALWSAETPAVFRARQGIAAAPKPDCTNEKAPRLTNVYPSWVDMGSTADVLLIGCNFPAAAQVRFNGGLHQVLSQDANRIHLQLTPGDVAAAGNIVLTLSADGRDFDSGMLSVVPGSVYWSLFGRGPWNISLEVQLLLLVIMAGAFASCVYALKSLADYRGDCILYKSWFTYYLIQPFEGAGIALILYLVVRGGFLSGTGLDIRSVNQFGICAIAALAGAFSDTAFLKLREVFQNLFKPKDDRSGKAAPLKITTTSLPNGVVGEAYSQTLAATGGTGSLTWSVDPDLPSDLTLDENSGAISGTPTAPAEKKTYRFTVSDSAEPALTATCDLPFEITAKLVKQAVAGKE